MSKITNNNSQLGGDTSASLPDDVVLRVSNVSKKFCKNLRRSMAYGIKDLAQNLVGVKQDTRVLRKDEFWALNEVSFAVKRGNILGIIGANGSGKTTLLRLMTGVFPSDKGEIEIRGRVSALIALGAGFHPHMTGRENIYLNGAILGMSREEVDSKLEKITEFSELADFLDAPLSTYSSGMYVRLGFSVAIHLEPDVLFVDEVLAVGDASFRAKSRERMRNFLQRGKTICLVSHDLMAIDGMCRRVIWLDKGMIRMDGTAQEVIPNYMLDQDCRVLKQRVSQKRGLHAETGEIVITKCETLNQNGVVTQEFEYQARLIVRVHYHAVTKVETPYFMIYVRSGTSGAGLFNVNMLRDGGEPDSLEGKGWLDIDFGPLDMYPGVYRIHGQIRKCSTVEYFSTRSLTSFAVVSGPDVYGCSGRFAATYVRDNGNPFVRDFNLSWHSEG